MLPSVRLILLNMICFGIVLTLGKVMLDPTAGKRLFSNFTFPDAIPLAQWEFVNSQPLIEPDAATAQYDRVEAGRQYEYRYDYRYDYHPEYRHIQGSLRVEIRYVVNTNGDILHLQQQSSVKPASEVRQAYATQGFYYLFTTSDRHYLTSCINPRGQSTVTSAQFFHNRYTQDFQPSRLLAWGIGQENLIDQRCLWLRLSTPLQGSDRDRAFAMLRDAWQELTIWGQAQFPKPGILNN